MGEGVIVGGRGVNVAVGGGCVEVEVGVCVLVGGGVAVNVGGKGVDVTVVVGDWVGGTNGVKVGEAVYVGVGGSVRDGVRVGGVIPRVGVTMRGVRVCVRVAVFVSVGVGALLTARSITNKTPPKQ